MGKLFQSANDWQNDSIIRKTSDKWLYYVEGYKIAAELIEKELIEKLADRDFLIYPMLYLHRHYLELKLKEIIVEGNNIIGNSNILPKGEHRLIDLWDDAQIILNEVYNGIYKKPSGRIRNKIIEFHHADEKSDGFRYPIDKGRNDNLTSFTIINYRNFRDEFEEVKQFLEGIVDGLYVMKDNIKDETEI